MQGKIEATKQWPNNPGEVNLKIGQQWYKTKNIEMAGMQGQVITFEPTPWTNPNTQKTTYYINDYHPAGAVPGPADQAFDQAHAQAPHTVAPAPPIGSPAPPKNIDKDALISAQGVLKCCTQTDPATAWRNFLYLYECFNNWDGTVPQSPPTTQPPAQDFDDDIPF